MPLFTKGGRSAEERMARLTRGATRADDQPKEERKRERIDLFPTIGRALEPAGRANSLRVALNRAGIPLRPGEFVGFAGVVTGLLAALGYFMADRNFYGALSGGIIGVLLPSALLSFLQSHRQSQLQTQLPDALMIMAAGIRSGFSFTRCLQLVAEEMKSPIGPEFARTVHEITIGRSTQEALGRLVARTNSYDVDLCVTAVNIQLEVGGNLATILETIAETVRERFRLKGEIASLTAEGRLSGWVLFIAPIFMFFFLMKNNPDYMQILLDDPMGRIALYGAGMMMLIGGVIIKKMLDIDV
jgi:tight adherence protein B